MKEKKSSPKMLIRNLQPLLYYLWSNLSEEDVQQRLGKGVLI